MVLALHSLNCHSLGGQAWLLQEDSLGLAGLGSAALANGHALLIGRDHIYELDSGGFGGYLAWLVTEYSFGDERPYGGPPNSKRCLPSHSRIPRSLANA